MKKISVSFRAVFIYCFSLLITYIAGMSFGGILIFLFWLFLLYPLLAFIYIVYGYNKFGFYEDFSHEHPAKGDTIRYRIAFTNESGFTALSLGVSYTMAYPGMDDGIKDFSVTLKAKETCRKEYQIRCPYRGIYSVGLKSILFADPLGWLRIHPPVWFRTFYVYPRIVRLTRIPAELERSLKTAGIHAGDTADNTLFQALTDYRPGQPVRHMAWKKFISSGIPSLKTYEKSALPGLDIFIDLRRLRNPDNDLLEKEDCTIEILVAIVQYLLERNIRVSVYGASDEAYGFAASSFDYFNEFYKSTINIRFSGNTSLIDLLGSGGFALQTGSLLFITHNTDSKSFELMSCRSIFGVSLFTLLNTAGPDGEEKTRAIEFVNAVTEKGGRVIRISDTESIKEELERE